MDTVGDRLISCSPCSAALLAVQTQASNLKGGAFGGNVWTEVSCYVFLKQSEVYVPHAR